MALPNCDNFPHQEEEEDGNNHDDEEEQSKRSELSDKAKVTAVVELEPIAASEEEPQGKDTAAAPKTIGIMKKSRRTDSLVSNSNSGKVGNNPGCGSESQIQPVISGAFSKWILDQVPRIFSSVLPLMLSDDSIRNLDGFGGNPRCGTPSPPSTGLIEEESSCANPTSGAAMGNPTGHEASACNKSENACSKASILALHNWWESQIEYESDSSDEGF